MQPQSCGELALLPPVLQERGSISSLVKVACDFLVL